MSDQAPTFDNPFRPGAGHPPPYLAGRDACFADFDKRLKQKPILENLVITGLRGVGKTVLLDKLKPRGLAAGWLWVGTDLSESASLTEDRIATRLLADLSVATSRMLVGHETSQGIGFQATPQQTEQYLDFKTLAGVYSTTPGLTADKIKAVLELTWSVMKANGLTKGGIVFAYDEAQNLADHANKDEYPLSLLLDVFQSIQKKGVPFLLVLTGLPTLFPKLVEARTFAERMFHTMELDRLDVTDSKKAITKPMAKCPVKLSAESLSAILSLTRGYPYFIQFVCREVFDAFAAGQNTVPADPITRKLDQDFFAGRWHRGSDRQRDLMWCIAHTPSKGEDFTVGETTALTRVLLIKEMSSSHINQMLRGLATQGLTYKTRHGRYAFAVPLLGEFILREGAPEGAKPPPPP